MHAAKAKWQRASSQPLQCYLERQQSVALTPTKKDLAGTSVSAGNVVYLWNFAKGARFGLGNTWNLDSRSPSAFPSLSHSLAGNSTYDATRILSRKISIISFGSLT